MLLFMTILFIYVSYKILRWFWRGLGGGSGLPFWYGKT
jgi:hypothetical protein